MTSLLERVADALDPQPDKWAADPVGWIQERLGEHVWSKQVQILESIRDNRYTAVPSAHSTGKSHIGSRAVAWWEDSHPVDEVFAITTAPSSVQVKAILWRYIKAARRKGDLPGYITESEIPEWKIDGRLVAYGRKPQDLSNAEEAATAFQGIHARYVLVVVDEAGGVPKWLWDAVDSLVTSPTNRVLAIGNPDDPASHFERICQPGSGWNVIPISAYDTPAFTGEVVPQEMSDVLVSEEWVEERKKRWGEGSSLFISKVLGQFPELTDDTLIAPSLINKARYETDLSGPAVKTFGQYGCDIARLGADETCIYRNRAGFVRLEYSRYKQDTMKTAGWIASTLRKHANLSVKAWIDVIGIGAGVYDRLKEQGLPVHPFSSSEKPHRRERFKNRRAEAYWHMRTMFEEGAIDIDPDDDDLAAELGGIKWWHDSSGRIVIESKEDMAKRGLHSPNRADAVMMSLVPPIFIPKVDIGRNRGKSLTSDLLERRM